MKTVGLLIALISLCFGNWPIDSVLSRADSCVQISWRPTSANTDLTWYGDNGAKCTGADAKYQNCDFIAGNSYRGIAYSYGGEDTPHQFEQKLEIGLAVGSHLCHYQTFGDPSPAVAGTDCSGFLCWAWNVSRVSTSVMVQNYPIIQRSAIQAGDALVKPGNHCVLVAEADNLQKAVIMESTSAVNSCRERIVNLTDSYWSGYTPIRNPNISALAIISTPTRSSDHPQLIGNQLMLPQLKEYSTIKLYSANGSIQYEQRVSPKTESITIPSQLAAGMYILTISSRSNEISLPLVVK